MWEEYMQEARTHIEGLGEQAIEIKYEDFLDDPARVLQTLSEFTGLEASPERIKELTRDVNKSRAYAYRNEPELEAFTKDHDDLLRAYGY